MQCLTQFPRRSLFSILGLAILLGIATTVFWPRAWGAAPKRAHAADSYSSPLTIDDNNYGNGTFSGNWASNDPNVPAITITTSKPVTIENSALRGPGDLILTTNTTGFNLTVRNTSGYGTNPNVAGRSKGNFIHASQVAKLDMENNYIEGTAFGVYVDGYSGSRSGDQTITIRANVGKNMDGRHSDGNNGYMTSQNDRSWSHFAQINHINNVPGIDISWNQVIDEPYNSSVDDVINIYQSGGTADSPLNIHDNYIQGAYPNDPKTDGYSGGGIITDGGTDTQDNASAYVHMYGNQVVDTANYGLAISNGHDNEIYNNRVISAGVLSDGTPIASQNVGVYISDTYGSNIANGTFHDNHAHDNTIGWVNQHPNYDWNNHRNDMYFPGDDNDYSRNTALPNPISLDMEKAEFTSWQQKLSAAGITLRSSTAAAGSSPADTGNLGGLTNLNGYCQSLGDAGASLDGNTAFDWHCDTSSGQHVGIDMNAACQWHYPNATNVSATYVMSDPYSWKCSSK